MATSFSDVIDQALVTVDDYKLAKLYNMSEEQFNKYCDGFLLDAVPEFTDCRQDLGYDADQRQFNNTLTSLEVSILADFWAIKWFKREVMNASQFNAALQTSQSFKRHSESQNLKEKVAFLYQLEEDVNRKLTRYQLVDIDNLEM